MASFPARVINKFKNKSEIKSKAVGSQNNSSVADAGQEEAYTAQPEDEMNVLPKLHLTRPVTGSVGQGQAPSRESAQVDFQYRNKKKP